MKSRDLRLLVTKYCNYKCVFCHQEGFSETVEELLTPNDYKYLFHICSKNFKSKTITITGGEPLVRKDILDVLKELYYEKAEITLTTNGFLLGKNLEIGKYLKKLNVSFHTAKKEKYEKIVQVPNSYEKLKESLFKFRNFNPNLEIVLNVTLVKDLNDNEQELLDILNFAKQLQVNLKFIELYPSEDEKCIKLKEVKDFLLKNNFVIEKNSHRKEKLRKENLIITLTKIFCEIVKDTQDENICNAKNALFISPNGEAILCRNSDKTVSLLEKIKSRNEVKLLDQLAETLENLGKNCKNLNYINN